MSTNDEDAVLLVVMGVLLLMIGQIICCCWNPVGGFRWFFGLLITLFGVFLLFAPDVPLV
jgi:hypothetical protein